jgi:hypothetical protein
LSFGHHQLQYIDNRSEVLQLQLSVDEKIIAFHRLDNGVKLLTNEELNIALEQSEQRVEFETMARQQAEQRAEAEAQKAEILADRLRQLGIDPENL